MSVSLGAAIAGGAFGPWLFGLVYDVSGTYAAGFWLAIDGFAIVMSRTALLDGLHRTLGSGC